MSLGENLQFFRKKDDITQEQLAEKLEVSRQSVSKWESDSAYPEMDKILQICELFHVSMDDLVRNDVSLLYVGNKTEYDDHMNSFSKMIAAGVGIILFGASLTLFLEGLNIKYLWFYEEYFEEWTSQWVTAPREGVFVGVPLIFVTVAVAIFILLRFRYKNYWRKNPCLPQFYSQSEIYAFQQKYAVMIVTGVTIILIDVIILISLEMLFPAINEVEYLNCMLMSLFMLLITFAVPILVYAGIRNSKYNIVHWNEMHDTKSETYKKSKLKSTVSGCLMLIATILFLIFEFAPKMWRINSVMVFPIFGIGCGIASVIVNRMTFKDKTK